MAKQRPILIVHGGVGVDREHLSHSDEKLLKAGLRKALRAGYAILTEGGTALDAVQKSVEALENDSAFNAGKGAALTALGQAELDAAVMDGRTLRAGAVAYVNRIRNPIHAARAVLEKTAHVLLVGDGAHAFARHEKLKMVEPEYFVTSKKREELDLKLAQATHNKRTRRYSLGTVGAVAVDKDRHVAAATSTGGMTGKMPGRVGDSPLIGAGTYASDESGAVSATGHGEYFIRLALAKDVLDLHRYRKIPLQTAAQEVILRKLTKLGGEGGIISVNPQGDIGIAFNTDSLYRAFVDKTGKEHVALFRE